MSDVSYKADEKCYKYFARLETWTREEAAALLLQLDPRTVLERDPLTGLRPADRLQPFRDILKMLNRAKTALPDDTQLKPELILNWTKSQGYNPPKLLIVAVKTAKEFRNSGQEIFSEVDFNQKPEVRDAAGKQSTENNLHHKTRTSMLKLIAGMAVRGYSYDPKLRHNSAITDIETDLRLLNIPLSDDTIRRWVNEACELIDWEMVNDEVK